MKKGIEINHPIYGKGITASEPETVDTHQWSGTAIWCVFHSPQTAIAAGWPYMVPVGDLTKLND